MDRSRLIFTLHNHQPVGNFDDVIRDAVDRSYQPFLDVLADFPTLRVVLHNSGCLLDWLTENATEYVDQLRAAVARGQVELIGGPMDEPILAAIPRRDRIGQIRMHTERIRDVFGVEVSGMWVPERVWEHSFTADLAAAGIRYTVLDDTHFLAAGLTDDQLTGSFLCEDEGRVLRVFPIHERLRHTIPFHPVHEVIGEMRDRAERHPGSVMVFADDGEKFGVWPGTHRSVYEEGWLRHFFQQLVDQSDWLQTATFGDLVEDEEPVGRIALPDCSYREMTEWALPPERQRDLEFARTRLEPESDDTPVVSGFLRGGNWRNFLSKYPESAAMAARMKEVSNRLQHARGQHAEHEETLSQATRALYRGQCNCPYWHGAFGGLYLSHLRQATYANLIHAETLLAQLQHGPSARSSWVELETHDFNFDLRTEVKLSSNRLAAYVAAAEGGQLYELDVRGCRTNLLATLARRPEPYHGAIARSGVNSGGHDDPLVKEDGLEEHLRYDPAPLRSLVDHVFAPGLSFDEFLEATPDAVHTIRNPYRIQVRRGSDDVACQLICDSGNTQRPIRISKTIQLSASRPGDLAVHYRLDKLTPGSVMHFGVELNVAGMAANAADRYLYGSDGEKLGPTNSTLDLTHCRRLGAADEWLGLDVSFDWSEPADVWTVPVETVSGSEAGIEKTYQSTRIVPHWEFRVPDNGRWEVDLTISCDTGASYARTLSEVAQTVAS